MSLCFNPHCPGDILKKKGKCSAADCEHPDRLPVVETPRTGEFSVAQFFDDGTNEYVRRFVSAQEAMDTFISFAQSIGAKLGVTVRVIVTDSGDFTNMEWKYGEGIVFPEELKGRLK